MSRRTPTTAGSLAASTASDLRGPLVQVARVVVVHHLHAGRRSPLSRRGQQPAHPFAVAAGELEAVPGQDGRQLLRFVPEGGTGVGAGPDAREAGRGAVGPASHASATPGP